MAVNNTINNYASVFNSGSTITAATGITCTLNHITATSGNFVATAGDISLGRISADATAPNATFKKSRAGGVITTGDSLGEVLFTGHEGTGYINGAKITSTSAGTYAATRLAGDLKFYTHPDSAQADASLRLTIANTGAMTIAAPDAGTALTITNGGLTVSAGSTTLSALAAVTAGIVTKTTTGVLGAIENTANDGYVLISKADASNPVWAGLTAGAGVTITPGANSISIAASAGLSWNEAVADVAPMVVENGYIANKAGTTCSMALPASSAVGATMEVVGKGATGWIITQAANQRIFFGNAATTLGAAGTLASTDAHDCIELVCTTADLIWTVKSSVGNLTLA